MSECSRSKEKGKIKNQIYWMVILAIGLFLIGIALIIVMRKPKTDNILLTTTPNEVNFPAPEITLIDLNSKSVSLNNYPKAIILVNNWATWCPPCKAEMPTLQQYFQKHYKQGFVIIAIESGESINEVTKFVQEYSITFPVWIDLKGLALEKFNNWDLPSSYVIDRSGIVRLSWTGPINMQMLEKYVTPLLEQ